MTTPIDQPEATEARKQAAAILGGIGGASGTGDSKKRGNSKHYSELNRRSRAAREANKAKQNGPIVKRKTR